MRRFLLACLLSVTALAAAQQLPEPSVILDKEVVASFQSLPVQEGGRIKPLDTYARFLLLRIHGKQSISVEQDKLPGIKKLKAVEWLLLSWFRPDIARDLPLFVVDNSQAVGEIGVDPKGLRDRYSWNEIVKGREELIKRAQSYGQIESAEQTGVQRNVINLARNFFDFDAVSDFMTAARTDWKKEVDAILSPELAKEVTGGKTICVWDLAMKLGTLIRENKAAACDMRNLGMTAAELIPLAKQARTQRLKALRNGAQPGRPLWSSSPLKLAGDYQSLVYASVSRIAPAATPPAAAVGGVAAAGAWGP